MTDIPALVAWLRGCLDEDEAIAREAMADPGDDGVWEAEPGRERVEGKGIVIYDEGGHDPDQAAHIARWDPAAVLADIQGKRLILGMAEATSAIGKPGGPVREAVRVASATSWELAVRALARAYRGRPGWQEEWA